MIIIFLSKQARHMVIPYMPMLVPPLNWTGYVFLVSAINYFSSF